ncbi:Structural maintenance of chromosomes protein [Quillaja saponaria]|uniref:Structural maintenance of chromosomes protein n=1 Tax=Quillaja saponaria TaxID=32244 RepID=A0AAD7KUT8_QUISA|nr:Structural maintenance of chromosomes protein [Quillaja saponaria]
MMLLIFCSEDLTTPGNLDDLFVNDLNPCLTPYRAKTSLREFEGMCFESTHDEGLSGSGMRMCNEIGFNSFSWRLPRSSDCCQNSNTRSILTRAS